MQPKTFIMTQALYLAPFQGITTRDYRSAYLELFPGIDTAYAPFIAGVGFAKVNPSKFKDVLPGFGGLQATVPQFISTDAREVRAIAAQLQKMGYDYINWNMGCPFPRLANKKRGCGILPHPDLIRSLLDEVFQDMPVKLSIKTRLGYYNANELPRVMEIFNDYPIHRIIIHPRLGKQLYKGVVDLEGFAWSASLSKNPVVYNGDIYHAARFRYLQERFPDVSGWMIGRAALINPFLAAQIRGIEPSDAEKRNRLREFYFRVFEKKQRKISNEKILLGAMKALWFYMCGMFEGGPALFVKMKRCHALAEYRPILEVMFELPFARDEQIEDYFYNGMRHL